MMWRPSSKRQRIRMICLGISKGPQHKHKMYAAGRHPRHPKVHVFKCRNQQCTITIYWNINQGQEVRP